MAAAHGAESRRVFAVIVLVAKSGRVNELGVVRRRGV